MIEPWHLDHLCQCNNRHFYHLLIDPLTLIAQKVEQVVLDANLLLCWDLCPMIHKQHLESRCSHELSEFTVGLLQKVSQKGNVLQILCEIFDIFVGFLSLLSLRPSSRIKHISIENVAILIHLLQGSLLWLLILRAILIDYIDLLLLCLHTKSNFSRVRRLIKICGSI